MEKEKISDQDVFAQKDKLYNETKKVLEDRINQLVEQNNQNTKAASEANAVLQNEISTLNIEFNKLKKLILF